MKQFLMYFVVIFSLCTSPSLAEQPAETGAFDALACEQLESINFFALASEEYEDLLNFLDNYAQKDCNGEKLALLLNYVPVGEYCNLLGMDILSYQDLIRYTIRSYKSQDLPIPAEAMEQINLFNDIITYNDKVMHAIGCYG